MKRHKVFTLGLETEQNEVVAFIPTLGEAFLVSKNNKLEIPKFVELEDKQIKEEFKYPSLRFDRTTIVLTQRCNLGCLYCYEGIGGETFPNLLAKTMPWEVIKAVIDYVFLSTLEKKRNFNDNFCLINFFGGEPTVAWEKLKKAIRYANREAEKLGLNLKITLSTNGFFSEEKLNWLLTKIDTFNLSIDGPQDIHDALRPTASGDSSFSVVFRTAQRIYEFDSRKLLLRATISQGSVSKMISIASFFSKNFPGTIQAYEPLQETGRAIASKTQGPSMKLFLDQILEIMPVVEDAGGSVKISMFDLDNSGNAFCGVNGFNFIVTPEGLITSCNRKMLETEPLSGMFIFGRYDFSKQQLVFDQESFRKLRRYSTSNVPKCRYCFARYACRGGCPAIKADTENKFWKITANYCHEIKEFIIKVLFYKLHRESADNKD